MRCVVVVLAVAASGCTAPNPEFVPDLAGWGPAPDLTGYVLVPVPDMTAPPDLAPLPDLTPAHLPPTLPDVTGSFLLSVSTVINPDLPLVFLARVRLTPKDTDGATMRVELQPLLAFNMDANKNGRPDYLPVGSPFSAGAANVGAGGAFTVDLGTQNIIGAANPISGSDITVLLRLSGGIRSADRMCGEADGALSKPFAADLKGSTWGAVRVPVEATGEALPAPDWTCGASPDMGPTRD